MKGYVLIVGIGKSGKSVYNTVLSNNLLPIFFDDEFSSQDYLKGLVEECECVVVSPGIKPSHKLFFFAKKYKKVVYSEIDYSYQHLKSNFEKTIGVTGTNGKTTVVTMLNHILNNESVVAGNVGIALSSISDRFAKYLILELSSFQLEHTNNLKLDVASITNLAPDHLNYHGTLKKYYQAKHNILKNMQGSGLVVLNGQDRESLKTFCDAKEVSYFGCDNRTNCIFVEDSTIYIKHSSHKIFVADLSVFGVCLKHNIQNMINSLMIIDCLNECVSHAISRLISYEYQPYRMKMVYQSKLKVVFNDSKSTNVASCLSAIDCVGNENKISLIIGGRFKNESFAKIFKCKCVENIYLYGESKNSIYEEYKKVGGQNIEVFDKFDDAVVASFKSNNRVVLFSPACASFDMFSGYEERGERFNELVKDFFIKH